MLAATDYVIPAVEIIDARIQQIDPETKVARKVVDTISDNAANAGIVVSAQRVEGGGRSTCAGSRRSCIATA